MRLNYVIAAWGGPRRSDDLRAEIDRTFFLRQHLAQLERVPHTLAEITIVIPESPREDPDFTAYVEKLPFPIIRRSNAGFSYGSWTEAHRQTRDRFDGYIFVEDDYVFVEDHFDQRLLDIATRHHAEFVCGAVLPFHRYGWEAPVMHPGIALGYCSTAAMDRWAAFRNPMPYATIAENYQDAEFWQVLWGADFTELNIKMVDWREDFAAPFWTNTKQLCWYGPREARPLVLPLQAFGRTTPRFDPEETWQEDFVGPDEIMAP